MWDYFSENVQQLLIRAQLEAQKTGADFIGSEHLMLGILWNRHNTACRVLKQLEVDLSSLQEKIFKMAKKKTGKGFSDFPFSARAARILEIAYTIARNFDKPSVGSEHILLGILRESNGETYRILSGDFRVDLPTITEQLYGIDQLKLNNVMESRRAVEEGLKLLESRCLTTVMKEKIDRSKIDEALNMLEYAADLLWSMGYHETYRELLALRNRITIKYTGTDSDYPPPDKTKRTENAPGPTAQKAGGNPHSGISITVNIEEELIRNLLSEALNKSLQPLNGE